MTTTARTRLQASRTTGDGRSSLAGTGLLLRFMLRRDRVRIPVWVVALAGMSILVNSSWQDLYGTQDELREIAASLESPAIVAMTGVNYAGVENVTLGSLMAQQMLWFTLIGVALMSILLLVRHTRAEEEAGRAELVRASVVGRHAYLTAAFLLIGLANLAVGVITAVGLGAAGVATVDWSGSWLYGAAHVAVGMAFGAIAAAMAQISQHSRGAAGMGIAVLGAAYALRAMGDVGDNGLNWLSPIGWGQETRVYVEDRWWPLLVAVAVTIVVAWWAYRLSTRRDVGAGLRASRPGPSEGSGALTHPLGFAMRLHRALGIGFGVGLLLLAAAYGSVMGDIESLLGEVEVWRDMLERMAGTALEAFGATVMTVLAVIASLYAVLAVQRARAEENAGRAEPVLATAVSRTRWLGSHVTVALVGGAVMLVLAGIGFGGVTAAVVGDGGMLGTFVGGALAYAPALWLTVGVAVALMGWLPRAFTVIWIIPVYGFVTLYLGGLLQFPAWMTNLSPFGHVPQIPVEDVAVLPLLLMTGLAAVLVVAGLAGFRRRDLETT